MQSRRFPHTPFALSPRALQAGRGSELRPHTPLGAACPVLSFILVLRVVIKTVATRGH